MSRGLGGDVYLPDVLLYLETASVPGLVTVLEKLAEELDGRRLNDAAARCRDAEASIRQLRVGQIGHETLGGDHAV